MYKGYSKGSSVDFSAEILQAKREWNNVFKQLEEEQKTKPCKPKMLYMAKLIVRIEERMIF